MPTLHYGQTTYQGIERVSKEKCRSIDGHQLLRHKRLDREACHKGTRSKKCWAVLLGRPEHEPG
jgi:hypothetical protein